MKVTSIVLAGGKSLRLGRSKALEIIAGQSLIERVVDRLKPISSRILIVTSQEQSDLKAPYPAEVLVDLYPGKGPLCGIYTGLLASPTLHNVVVACDMPFLNARLLSYMVEMANDFDAVIPRLDEERIEPLHAVYSRGCLDSMKKQLERNQLGIPSFLNTLRVRYLERAECQRFDPHLLSFFNINYQSDLDRAVALAAVD